MAVPMFAIDIDDGEQIDVGIVQADEVIGFDLNAIGHFNCGCVRPNRSLISSGSFWRASWRQCSASGPVIRDAHGSFHASIGIDPEIGYAFCHGGLIEDGGGGGKTRSVGGKMESGGQAVLPMNLTEGAHFLSWIEENALACNFDFDEIIVQLTGV